ncbi:Anaphase-promoting complex subunit 2 [Coemansia sp. RSA 2424]|nr:Anaphase-promoting complex subunit 2 [Coemansia sp. RSA 2424]
MYACGLFDTPSEDDIQRIVQQIKARSKSSQTPRAGLRVDRAIDSLAAQYSCSLQSMCKAEAVVARAASDAFYGFVQFLKHISDSFRSFSKEAAQICGPEQRIVGDMAWDALVYQILDERVLAWMEEWMYATLWCVLHCMQRQPESIVQLHSLVSGRVSAQLEQFHRNTGVAVAGFCDPDTAQLFVSGASADSDEDATDSDPAESRRRDIFARYSTDASKVGSFICEFAGACQLLVDMRFVKYTGGIVSRAVDRLVDSCVQKQAARWDAPCLDSLLACVQLVIATLDALLCSGPPASAQVFFLGHAESRLYAKFCELRVSELFGIIIDYPDSRLAIVDLRACVVRLRNMRQVAHSLRNAIQQRLLHPGATTSDILTQYISAIRCLRLLDPSSTVLEIVARPIRAYLRSREDTVSCIVQDMVSEESELFEDLASGQGVIIDSGAEGIVYDEDYADKSWEPLPIEAKSVYLTAQRRDADVLSLLVSIYETKDVFVQEFERHLAQRLLACANYNAEREIKQVEMMKLRFGDRALEKCEVMLKDVAESKRTDQLVAEASTEKHWDMPLHALIVSRQFWSSAPREQFVVPCAMADIRDKYAGMYESLKPARKLEWRDALGSVALQVELADRTISVLAKPAQAAVLFAFQETPVLALADLAQRMECTEEFALSRVRFWQTRGVVRENDANVFEVVETENGGGSGEPSKGTVGGRSTAATTAPESTHGDEDDDDEGSASGRGASSARTEALRVHFNFIEGMLRNFGPLPLDRIQSMLGMFLPGDSTTVDELRSFLALMAREDKLEMAGGLYKLK